MIRSFKCPDTAALASGVQLRRLADIVTVARRKRRLLEIVDYH